MSANFKGGGEKSPPNIINSNCGHYKNRTMQPRIYTYKITFEEVSYYYYGVHKERKYNEEYWGSPKTNKWCWELYTPKKQILELFDYTDEGWLKANKVEQRIIILFYNDDKWCLNKSCGGVVSLDISRKIGTECGKFAYNNKLGIFSISLEEKQELGRMTGLKMKEEGRGIFSIDKETHIKNCKRGGKTQGNLHKINKTGFFTLSKKELSLNGKRGGKLGGKTTGSQKWMCLETGFVTTPGALSMYQKKKGIDISKRVRIL
jgi:hypothetical protein